MSFPVDQIGITAPAPERKPLRTEAPRQESFRNQEEPRHNERAQLDKPEDSERVEQTRHVLTERGEDDHGPSKDGEIASSFAAHLSTEVEGKPKAAQLTSKIEESTEGEASKDRTKQTHGQEVSALAKSRAGRTHSSSSVEPSFDVKSNGEIIRTVVKKVVSEPSSPEEGKAEPDTHEKTADAITQVISSVPSQAVDQAIDKAADPQNVQVPDTSASIAPSPAMQSEQGGTEETEGVSPLAPPTSDRATKVEAEIAPRSERSNEARQLQSESGLALGETKNGTLNSDSRETSKTPDGITITPETVGGQAVKDAPVLMAEIQTESAIKSSVILQNTIGVPLTTGKTDPAAQGAEITKPPSTDAKVVPTAIPPKSEAAPAQNPLAGKTSKAKNMGAAKPAMNPAAAGASQATKPDPAAPSQPPSNEGEFAPASSIDKRGQSAEEKLGQLFGETGIKSKSKTTGSAAQSQVFGPGAKSNSAQMSQTAAPQAIANSAAEAAQAAQASSATPTPSAMPIMMDVESALGTTTMEVDPVTGAMHVTGSGSAKPSPMGISEVSLNFTRARMVQMPAKELAIEIAKHASDGKSKFEIRVNPPELGRIEVKLEISETGRVTAQLFADKSDTLDLLQKDRSTLEKALAETGLDFDRDGLDFQMRQDRDEEGEGNKGPDGAIDSEVIAHLEEMGLTQSSPMELSRYGFDVIRMERIDVRA